MKKTPPTSHSDISTTYSKILGQILTSTRKRYFTGPDDPSETMRSPERRLQLLIDSLPARISYVDTEGRYILVNTAFENILTHTREEVIGNTMAEVLGPDNFRRAEDYINQALGGQEVRFEFEFKRSGGDSVWLDAHYVPDIDDQGQVKGFYTLSRDLTQQRSREAELRRQHDLLETLFNNILIGIALLSPDGCLLRVNRAFTDLTGYTQADVPDLETWFERAFPDPTYRASMQSTWQKDSGQKTSQRDFRVRCRDGSMKYIEFRASFLEDGRALVTLSDISDRQRAESSIRQSERRFRGMFERAPVGVAILDTQRRFLEVNQKICDVLGYRADEMVGRSLNEFTHPEDQEGGRRRWRQLLEQQVEFNQAQKRYIHKDGHTIWVIVSNTLIRDDQGSPQYILGHLMDISAQVQAQEEKEAYEKKLLQAQKMEAIGTLAGGLAHDFNNLLMGIQGRASLMLLDMPPGHPHQEHVAGIEKHVRSAAALAQQLLGYARGGKYDVKAIRLNELVRNSTTMFGRTRKEIQIHHNLQNDLPAIEADHNQIEQVLLNLFVNAWQAMPEGGHLYVKTEVVQAGRASGDHLRLPPQRCVRVSVGDTGIGMDRQTMEKIFDPFFTTKEKSRGTGLGLASVYGIVNNHGGSISVNSQVGKGTTFELLFPVSDKSAQPASLPDGTIEKGSETLLLVDDEVMIQDVGRSLLQRLGYTVLTAGSGPEAVNLITKDDNRIDLVILDLIMPGMDGNQTFDRIRALKPDLKVILSSGYARDGKAETVLKKGCHAFIQKPFDLATLSRKLRAVLEAPSDRK